MATALLSGIGVADTLCTSCFTDDVKFHSVGSAVRHVYSERDRRNYFIDSNQPIFSRRQKIVKYTSAAKSATYDGFVSARCNMYISRLCYDVSVRLSVTEVH